MRILTIRFKSAAPYAEIEASWLAAAPRFNTVSGLLSKTWVRDGDLLGGIYTFRDQTSLDSYLAGPIVASMKANPALSDFRFEQYDLLENLSAVTHGVPVTVAG